MHENCEQQISECCMRMGKLFQSEDLQLEDAISKRKNSVKGANLIFVS